MYNSVKCEVSASLFWMLYRERVVGCVAFQREVRASNQQTLQISRRLVPYRSREPRHTSSALEDRYHAAFGRSNNLNNCICLHNSCPSSNGIFTEPGEKPRSVRSGRAYFRACTNLPFTQTFFTFRSSPFHAHLAIFSSHDSHPNTSTLPVSSSSS